MDKPATPPMPPLPPPRPDDGGKEFLRMTLGYHGDVWPPPRGAEAQGQTVGARSDELLREQLLAELANMEFDASGVNVAVNEGVVELSGVVGDARALRLAVEIATGLLGVEKVVNDLVVEQNP
ncbi:MAG: BON domain-containing protein [Polyangiaceae bacterium]